MEPLSRRFVEDRLKVQNPWWELKTIPAELVGRRRDVDFEEMSGGKEIRILFGVRRCGKSTLLFQVMRHLVEQGVDPLNLLMLNFDFERFRKIPLDEVFKAYLELSGASPRNVNLFLDEVHFREDWPRFTRRLYDMREVNRIFITDSSSKLLKGEYARILTGRTIKHEVFPLSFREFLSFLGVSAESKLLSYKTEAKVKNLLREYLEFGGFPEVVLKNEVLRYRVLQEYFSDIIYKDVAERFNLDASITYEVAKFLITNVSKYVTLRSLRRGFGIGLETASKILQALEEVRLINLLRPFSLSLKSQVKGIKKAYAIDTGLSSAAGFRFSENFGKLAENTVFLHLRRMQSKNPLLEIFYWRDYQQNEVDFIIKNGVEVKRLIQVTYASGRDEIEKREIRALSKASGELGCNDLLIITWDYEDEIKNNDKKIECIPLWKWLLSTP
ncbi:MAG: ATP-binding protein [Thermoproteota archaeon]